MQTKPLALIKVPHFLSGAKPQTKASLAVSDVEALARAFLDQGQSAPVGSRAHVILDDLAKTGSWLLCNCKGESLTESPVLYVSRRHSQSRPLTLVRNHARGLHDAACRFHKLPGQAHGHSLAEREAVVALAVLKSTDGATASGTERRSFTGTSRSQSTPRLARVLFTLLEHAGLNRIVAGRRSISRDADKLMEAAEDFWMDKGKTIPAADFVGPNLHRFDKIAKRVEDAANWPKSLSPHGFVIGLCDRARDASGTMHLINPFDLSSPPESWEVKGRVRLPGPGTVGPYLAIGLVAKVAGSSSAEIVQAYVHPAYDFDGMLLVDSELERQTLAIITERLAEMKGRKDPYTIVKPYVDVLEPSSNTPHRPDFVINYRGREMAVETMGYTDEEYLTRKARMHQVMKKQYYKVFEHYPGENDEDLRGQIEGFVGYTPE